MTLRIPPFLHDVFGESQTPAEILTIALFGLGLATTLFLAFPEMTQGVSLWRGVVAYLLVLDIGAGCVANFTRSTSNYYAARPQKRLLFIAIHFHPLVVAGLLAIELWPAIMVWAYTIVGALAVNALQGSRFQLFTAGALLTAGISIAVLGATVPHYFLVIILLFMVKLLFSFAVDHYHQTEAG